MSNPLGWFLDAIGGVGRSVPRNDVFMPDWAMVSRKSEVLNEMRSSGEAMAAHACTCNSLECVMHFTDEPTWVTPGYFLKYVEYTLGESIKSAEASDNEDAMSAVEEIKIFLQQWQSMTPDQIMREPRYRAFAVGFDSKLLQYITQHYSYRVPKH
jgi:hypothetical protein